MLSIILGGIYLQLWTKEKLSINDSSTTKFRTGLVIEIYKWISLCQQQKLNTEANYMNCPLQQGKILPTLVLAKEAIQHNIISKLDTPTIILERSSLLIYLLNFWRILSLFNIDPSLWNREKVSK